MLGAIIGDIIGSVYERDNVKTTHFYLFTPSSRFTDDTVMTLAIAKWLTDCPNHSFEELVTTMQILGHNYLNVGYGGRFLHWLTDLNPQPYGSFGNGSAMRVSPIGLYADTLEDVLRLSKLSAEVTHNHVDGIKGAQAIATAVFLAKKGESKEAIRNYIEKQFGYDLHTHIEDIRATYTFDSSCQGSVPQAIIAFLDGNSFEEVIRLAISLGGDSDTIIEAQDNSLTYNVALKEMQEGRKQSHWMWYIFPQLKGLGSSTNSLYYGLVDIEEAEAYLTHTILGSRLREITKALLNHCGKDITLIMGDIDAIKLRSSMTLFDVISPNDIFSEVLKIFYESKPDKQTLQKLNK